MVAEEGVAPALPLGDPEQVLSHGWVAPVTQAAPWPLGGKAASGEVSLTGMVGWMWPPLSCPPSPEPTFPLSWAAGGPLPAWLGQVFDQKADATPCGSLRQTHASLFRHEHGLPR